MQWTNNYAATVGTLRFADATREVRWEIPRLTITAAAARAAFKVAVTPTEAQLGQLLPLLGVSRAEATDAITQVDFTVDAPSVSTALETDPLAKGKGVVQ